MTPTNEHPWALAGFKRMAWGLALSVLLNLFLVGAFVGVMPHAKHRPFAPMALATPHGQYLIDWLTRYLDPADAQAFRESFTSQATALKQAHEHAHQAVGELAAVFGQDSPDPAALQAALNDLVQARSEASDAIGKVLQDAYVKLSPEGRRRLADLAENPM